MTFRRKSIAAICILAAATVLISTDRAQAQDDSGTVLYYVGKSVRRHPDGAVGSVSFSGSFQYATVSKSPNVPVSDIQRYQAGLGWIAADYLTLLGRFQAISEDSVSYELNGGIRLYLANPVSTNRNTNPDGAVGVPVLTVVGGLRAQEFSDGESKFVGDVDVTVPVSRRLSLSAGYRHFEEMKPDDVDKAWGGLTLFLATYNADSSYANPDGPVGTAAFHLTGGGSSEGFFGNLAVLFPISDKITWKLVLRGERVEFPYKRSAFVGGGFSLYPSN